MSGAANSTDSVDILGVQVSRRGLLRVLGDCGDAVHERNGGFVCFANVHTVTEAVMNPELARAFREAWLAVADGVPLVWLSRWKGERIASRVCGPDFMREFMRAQRAIPQGFIGGAPGEAEKIAKMAGVQSICHSPPLRVFSTENALQDWKRFLELCPGGKAPAVVWVGLGAPKQELWMREISKLAPQTLFFGVGAAFDFLSGEKERAPFWMRQSGLEWLFRLIQEPGRLWKRYLVGNSIFLYLVLAEILSFEWALVAFLALTLFAPPFDEGIRNVFLGDLWAFFAAPFYLGAIGLRQREDRKPILIRAAASLGLFVVVYLHGMTRPSLLAFLPEYQHYEQPDDFIPFKEAVVGLRFVAWYWLALASAHHRFSGKALKTLQRCFVFALFLLGLSMFLAQSDFSISKQLGSIYKYDPDHYPWAGRIYGVFQSPVEAGASLAFGGVIALACRAVSPTLRALALLWSAGAVVTSKTMTGFFTWGAIAALWLNSFLSPLKKAMAALTVAGAGFLLMKFFGSEHFIWQKGVDLVSRLDPWMGCFRAAMTRWDLAVFGFGFNPYHADSSFLFVFNRGGLLLFAAFVLGVLVPLIRKWRSWDWSQRAIPLYLLISSLTLDALILRPILALLIAVAIPLLQEHRDMMTKSPEH